MSHTNSTPNYQLPQFVGTDKPAYLTDFNQAFSAIDTGIAAAKSSGDTAQADVNELENELEQTNTNLSNLTSTVSTVSGVASSASNASSQNSLNITAIDNFFKIGTPQDIKNSISINAGGIGDATRATEMVNANGTCGKLSLNINFNTLAASSSGYDITVNTSFRPSQTRTLSNIATIVYSNPNTNTFVYTLIDGELAPNGVLKFHLPESWYNRGGIVLQVQQCLILLTSPLGN